MRRAVEAFLDRRTLFLYIGRAFGGGVFDCEEARSPRERQVARARAGGGGVGGRGGVMHGEEVVNSAYEVY